MFKIFILSFLFFYSFPSHAQIKDIYLGFDIGFNKDFTTFTRNDNGYFLAPQQDWLGYAFLEGNRYFSGSIGVRTFSRYVFEFSFSNHTVADYANFFIPEINKGRHRSSSSPYFKSCISVGKELKIFRRFYLIPSLMASYIRTDFSLNEISGWGASIDTSYLFTYESTNYSNNHFLLGAKLLFQWKFNDFLNLNLTFGYNQGLPKSYQINYQLLITDVPDKVYEGSATSRLSHTSLSLGLQYNLKRYEKTKN
jgi:hypothetical protein